MMALTVDSHELATVRGPALSARAEETDLLFGAEALKPEEFSVRVEASDGVEKGALPPDHPTGLAKSSTRDVVPRRTSIRCTVVPAPS